MASRRGAPRSPVRRESSGGGREREPSDDRPPKAPLAQWSEQRPFKSWVVGSNPTGGTAAVGGTAGNREWNPVTRHIGRVIKSVRVDRALNTIGRTEKPPSRKDGEYRRSDVHAYDPGDACGRRRGEEAYAPVAQRKERHPPEVGVAGSNPAEGTSGRMTSHGKPKSVGAFPPPWRMHGGVKRAWRRA